jgi:hypothetical protein
VSETDLYVYGVVGEGAAAPSGTGVEGGELRLVAGDGLAALVSDVPPGDLTPTRQSLTTHMEVLRGVGETTTVLPMRFGVVLPDDDAVRSDLLEAYATRLGELLAAVANRAELELRATFHEDALMRSVVEERPDIRKAREQLEGRDPDGTYYDRIQLGEQVMGAVSERRDQIRAEMLDALSPLAVDVRVGEPAHELDAMSASFLVDADRIQRFDDAVQELDRRHGELVRLRYFGPLPPHSFVDLEGDVPAWA